MHIYFSGIGGTGIGPLALIAHQAGLTVSGSDKQDSAYIHYLKKQGLHNITIGQSYEQIAELHAMRPIDWFVYSSAVAKEQAGQPELRFCKEQGVRSSRRSEFLSEFIASRNLKLIAIAGTHGKTTTTAMAIWAFKELGIAASHSVGAKMSFAEMGTFNPHSDYFIYEADEYDRNFLYFSPHLSMITGIDWDHADIYPTRENYYAAFVQFLSQSNWNVVWKQDVARIAIQPAEHYTALDESDPQIQQLTLAGEVNRRDAWQVAQSMAHLFPDRPLKDIIAVLNRFPGVSRRFEQLAPNIYTDYAHTPPKIRGALQLAHEIAGNNVVVVYEGLHNTRQHFIKDELNGLFDGAKHIYIVPSYLAREDENLPLLTPVDLSKLLGNTVQDRVTPSTLDDALFQAINQHAKQGDLVLCITAGGGNSLDEWLRDQDFALGTSRRY
ncbi:MAG TPA: Mur ligase domain-containing protein [Candidatus Saccharimonadales bacterium]|nr:Mur ligase domain-containing protein [Candidatus Saccharimonadales bacterium]